jgi:hypothetical protein
MKFELLSSLTCNFWAAAQITKKKPGRSVAATGLQGVCFRNTFCLFPCFCCSAASVAFTCVSDSIFT